MPTMPSSSLPLLLLLLLLLWINPSPTAAQQSYIESDQQGYTCITNTTSCRSYASYRALQGENLQTIGLRFGLSVEQLAGASNLSQSAVLAPGQLLLIPLNCSCAGGRSAYNVTYIIQAGDTMYIVSNNTFQGLTTFQAVERANPSVVATALEPGNRIVFPIRCACPTPSQTNDGVESLLTYSINPGETLGTIASNWNVPLSSIRSQNTVSGAAVENSNLQAFTTLLLPATVDPPRLPRQTVAAAPPPTQNDSPPGPDSSSSGSSSSNTGTYVGIAVGCVAAAVLAVVFGVFCYRRRTRRMKKSSLQAASYGGVYGSKGDEGAAVFDHGSMSSGYADQSKEQSLPRNDLLLAGMHGLVDSEKPVVFSYEELSAATNEFSPSHLIRGSVYRGVLRKQLVAIKEMKTGTTSQEFKILCKVHHSNLVRLVGVCSGDEKLFLVYEYADNGSLSSCLHNKSPALSKIENATMGSASVSSASLSWNTRVQIAVDVATGLEYIHDYTKPSFVHKDVKSSNILLDANLRAKIANFGMARLVNDAALTKHIAGTQGYMSPEYLAHGFVTVKVDVYAFGVVLLEIFTGREAILNTGGDDGPKQYLADAFVKLVDEFASCDEEQKIAKIKPWADPILDNAVPWEIAVKFVEIARSCIEADPDARPSMKDVTFKLSKLLESSMEWETAAVLSRRYNTAPLEGR